MIEAIDHRLNNVAEAYNLVFQTLQPLHWSSVERLHCTGVESLHWSLHWSRGGLLADLSCLPGVGSPSGPGLNFALAGEGIGAGLHRAAGDTERLGHGGRLRPSLPEGDEAGRLNGGHR
jgi:hypothetical protein